MVFGPVFLLAALGFGGLAAALPAAAAWPVGWIAAACGAASAAWLGLGPPPYGKRADGTRALWSRSLLLPFLLPVWVYWHARRPFLREPPWHELTPDILIGRRLLDREFTFQVDHIIDLTCEYAARPAQRAHSGYCSLPIVDGTAPDPATLAAYTERLRGLRGRIYVHCAEGHGRTSLIAAALLLTRGDAADPVEALEQIAARRPKARPYAAQRHALCRYWETRYG